MCDENTSTIEVMPVNPVVTAIDYIFSYVDVPIVFGGGIDVQALHRFITTGINGGVDAIISASVTYHNPPLERGNREVLVTVGITSQCGHVFLRFIPVSAEDKRGKWLINAIANVLVEVGLYRLPGSRKKPNDFHLVNPRHVTDVKVGYDGENMTLLTLDAEWIPGIITPVYMSKNHERYILFRHNDPGRTVLKGLLARMPQDKVPIIDDAGV
jgi:hypothetical protein